jgi:16S rRNA processing protein RimM
MVTFKGYDNINQVLNYLKMNVYVRRSDLELSKDDYILDDLIGLSVEENGEMLGKVEEIVYNGINILLSVVGEKSFYIPVSGNFIKKVDLEKGKIETEGAKGLIL